ncbi:hypothetical protein XFF6990_140200 [Xanthomonas citri pv. fuscans]|uniref:Uncharacterized protein n=1 Tax=Xanthomonas campestris pv. phaseoli TaxID=317013 RepID=A0A7Z7NEZ1_XANCH|nr:hypothetical protein XFF6990_140200 [Xanthomonas citri pv. fuscans]SOO22121.1 hypothetical protein XFF6991_110009 [Xanthomonas phaseoli pv. phaseoli]
MTKLLVERVCTHEYARKGIADPKHIQPQEAQITGRRLTKNRYTATNHTRPRQLLEGRP